MPDYLFEVDLGDIAAQGPIDATAFPHLAQSVRFFVDMAHSEWIERIRQAKGVWVGDKQRYVGSLQARMTGDFSGEVWTDLKLAEQIDLGRPQRDLKDMLNTSHKVRRSSKGHRYLIIPFRHNTPGSAAWNKAMRGDVYKLAKQMSQSKVTGNIMRPSGLTASDPKTKSQLMVPGHTYKWGDRLPAGLAQKSKPFHATDPFAGMVRIASNSPKAKSSTYLTFRVMSEQQSGKWLIAPKPGLHIARAVEEKLEKLAQGAFEYAMQRDIEDIVGL